MGQKDTVAKDYLKDNAKFADLFNYYLFGGKKIISADTLNEKDSTEIIAFFDETGEKKSILNQKWRDLLKSAVIKYDKNAIYVILGIENQSDIHYANPVKDMVYDAISYSTQVNDTARKHRTEKDLKGAEFLSGFSKSDKIHPVITLTVYYGADKWDAPRSLHEMLSVTDPEILRFVNDYKTNLIIPNEIEDFSKFSTDIGKLLNFIKVSQNKESLDKLLNHNSDFKNVDVETVGMINTFTGTNISMKNRTQEGGVDMCQAWADHEKESINKGVNKGMDLLASLMDKLLSLGRVEDASRATKDAAYRDQLFKEFDLI